MSIIRAVETRNFPWDSSTPEFQILIWFNGRFPYRAHTRIWIRSVTEAKILTSSSKGSRDRKQTGEKKNEVFTVYFQVALLHQRALAYSQQIRKYIKGCALGFWCNWSEKNARSRSQADIYTCSGPADDGLGNQRLLALHRNRKLYLLSRPAESRPVFFRVCEVLSLNERSLEVRDTGTCTTRSRSRV